ncbi:MULTISPECIES: AzlC family ABC transporter permease [Virgibacillus]|uniref:AzlC family ABC transporter permease n=1 Tax=Virgibacillus dokdonensis TaxID=302167 RepID=A0ABU7VJ95_9BACI|nr:MULTISPECIES: AzlC family ABC transporter permease [Virgibacillus]NWO12393.1 AzlC family ABC transporter permease [Virgibacillus sp.]
MEYTNRDESMMVKPFWQGVKDCLPTVLGFLGIGLAAGVVQTSAGMSPFEVLLISMLLYAGSAQFVVAGMIVVGAPIISVVVAIFIVNLRYLLLSASLAPHFQAFSLKQNALNGFLLTDETYGVIANETLKNKPLKFEWLMGLNLTAYVNWIVANVAGSYFSTWLSNPEKFGMDFALSGMFIGLIVLQFLSRKRWGIDLVVFTTTVAMMLILSQFITVGGLHIIFATVVAATIGMVIKK